MHTVVFGWFGVSALWFVPLAVRLVIAAVTRDAFAGGRGTIRLWLGFAGVFAGSGALEAALAPHTGNALGHALLGVALRALGRGAFVAAPLLVLAGLPWLMGFSWRGALRWADRAFGLGLNIGPGGASPGAAAAGTRGDEPRVARGGLNGSVIRTTTTNAMAPKPTGRYTRPTVWQPPPAAGTKARPGVTPGTTGMPRGGQRDPRGVHAKPFEAAASARGAAWNSNDALSGARASRSAAVIPAGPNAQNTSSVSNTLNSQSAPTRPATGSLPHGRPAAGAAQPHAVGSPATALAGYAAARATQTAAAVPAAAARQAEPSAMQRAPSAWTQPAVRPQAPQTDLARGTASPAEPSPGVLETLKAIEANAAQWTALAGSSLARRGAAATQRPPAAGQDAPSDAHASAAARTDEQPTGDIASELKTAEQAEPTPAPIALSGSSIGHPSDDALVAPVAPIASPHSPADVATATIESPQHAADEPATQNDPFNAPSSASHAPDDEPRFAAVTPPWTENDEPLDGPMTTAPAAGIAAAASAAAIPPAPVLLELPSAPTAESAEPAESAAPPMPAADPSGRAPLRGHAPTEFTFHAPAASRVELPALDLLEPASTETEDIPAERLAQTGQLIEQRLQEFKVPVTVVGASAGPVITRFEIEPALGVRGSQIVGLMKDLSRGLGLTSIRVVETIPGKTCMGLELPNAKRQTIRLSEILAATPYQNSASKLTLAMGKDITGHPIVTDLAKAPHMLVAGTTGSGKSVAINAMIVSLLFKATPEEVRMIMIDPKMLELSVYEGIPHLLAPVVTDMKLAANALNWCVGEMEKRYRLMSAVGVRNLAGFNQKLRDAQAAGKKIGNPFSLTPDAPEPLSPLPLIVVVIDELADLMMVAGKKIEELIARLAQKARAAGIHLILATQRPSVDVITGLIKANIPTRVAFQVSSKIDSRTILDQMGAESLLGQGDMLFLPPGTGYPQRVHGAFVADEEVHRVVEHLKQFGEPEYEEGILDGPATDGAAQDLFGDAPDAEADPLYDEAVAFVVRTRRASISAVQRQLRIGYNRAARLVEQMEAAGLVSAMGVNGSREVIAPPNSDA